MEIFLYRNIMAYVSAEGMIEFRISQSAKHDNKGTIRHQSSPSGEHSAACEVVNPKSPHESDDQFIRNIRNRGTSQMTSQGCHQQNQE